MTPRPLIALAGLSLFGHVSIAQPITVVDTVSGCEYRSCALTIAPTWNGLAVVRGIAGGTVANLNFFFPRDIGGALGAIDGRAVGADSVLAAARRAVRLRRLGAVFTDAGILAVTVGGVRALMRSPNTRINGVLASIGLASLGAGVPFQFAADGALSQAVWWYNLRYAQTNRPGSH